MTKAQQERIVHDEGTFLETAPFVFKERQIGKDDKKETFCTGGDHSLFLYFARFLFRYTLSS